MSDTDERLIQEFLQHYDHLDVCTNWKTSDFTYVDAVGVFQPPQEVYEGLYEYHVLKGSIRDLQPRPSLVSNVDHGLGCVYNIFPNKDVFVWTTVQACLLPQLYDTWL